MPRDLYFCCVDGYLQDQPLPMNSALQLLRQPFKSTFLFGDMLKEVKAAAVTQAQGEATLVALRALAKPPQPSRFREYAPRRQSIRGFVDRSQGGGRGRGHAPDTKASTSRGFRAYDSKRSSAASKSKYRK